MSGTSPDNLDGVDVSGLAGLYALDALDGPDLERFEAYLLNHPEALAEVLEFQEAAARLASITVQPAPPSMRDAVLSSLGEVRQVPPSLDAARARRRRSPAQRVAGIAAAVLLLLGVGAGGYLIGASGDEPAALDEVAAVLANDDASVVTLTGEGLSARLVYSNAEGRGVVVSESLEPVADDLTYELWQLQGDEAIPVGLFTPDEDGVVEVALPVDLAAADAVAVTIEPAGGSETPTLPIIMSGEVA
jgi:anti-sigma-K factor RskA